MSCLDQIFFPIKIIIACISWDIHCNFHLLNFNVPSALCLSYDYILNSCLNLCGLVLHFCRFSASFLFSLYVIFVWWGFPCSWKPGTSNPTLILCKITESWTDNNEISHHYKKKREGIPLFIQNPLGHPIQTELLAKTHKRRKES